MMNRKQIVLVSVAAVAIGAAFLFPSWETLEFADTEQGQVLLTNYESRLFNNPPEYSDLREPRIVWKYAVHEAIAYAIVAGALFYFLRTKKSTVADKSEEKTSVAAAF